MSSQLAKGSPLGRGRQKKKKKSMSLLSTPKKTGRYGQVSNPKLHETIDLVDDEDDDVVEEVKETASPSKCPDIIVIDEVEASDTSFCSTPVKSVKLPSSSPAASTEKCPEKDSEDIEIVGVKIVCGSSRETPLRANNSAKKTTPSIQRKKRKSSCSITFSNMQQVVKRAKLRMSNSNNYLASTAHSSRVISKRAKKRANKVNNRILRSQTQNVPNRLVGISSRFARSRRCPVPIYDTLRELGPANPNFRSRPQHFIPVPANLFMNLAQADARNPFIRAPGPPPHMFRLPQPQAPSGPNNINVNPNLNQIEPGSKRPIVIDGSNVAMAHGNNQMFSCKGIKICAQFFLDRGHKDVTAFVPQFRTKSSESVDPHVLEELNKQGILKYTPSREVEGRRIASYDDRFIVQCAVVSGGVIISNDNYRDLYQEEPEWRETIQNRILQFTWVNPEWLMFPQDPMGKRGPSLDQFLLY